MARHNQNPLGDKSGCFSIAAPAALFLIGLVAFLLF